MLSTKPCVAPPLALRSSVFPTRRPGSRATSRRRAKPQSAQDDEHNSLILNALQGLSNKVDEVSAKVDNVARDISAKVDNVAAELGDVRRFQGTMVEMMTLANLPARLEGCKRVRFETDADLDAVFGTGTATAILGAVVHPSGGRMLRKRLLRRLLLAVRQELDDGISLPLQSSSGKGAAAVQAVLDILRPEPGQDRRRGGKKQRKQQQKQQQDRPLPQGAAADAEALLAGCKVSGGWGSFYSYWDGVVAV